MKYNIFSKKAPAAQENKEETLSRLKNKAEKIQVAAARLAETSVEIGGISMLVGYMSSGALLDNIMFPVTLTSGAVMVGSYGVMAAAEAVGEYASWRSKKIKAKLSNQTENDNAAKGAVNTPENVVAGIKQQKLAVR